MKVIFRPLLASALIVAAPCINSSASAADAPPNSTASGQVFFNPDFALQETSFTLIGDKKISYLRPVGFHESVIASDQVANLSYSDQSNRVLITITQHILDEDTYKALLEDDTFFEGETAKFSDKEHLLWGEYELIDYQKDAEHSELTLKGFLKKPADGILPDQQNYLYQRSQLVDNQLLKVTCQVQGSQAMAASSKVLYETIEAKLEKVAKSVKLQD